MTAFYILRNFASLSESGVQGLENSIYDPPNGFLPRPDAPSPPTGPDRFQWCLQATAVLNQYRIKIYGRAHGIDNMVMGDSKDVLFKDHSEAFQIDAPKSLRKRRFGVDLPNPQYLKTHDAVTGILHMSGAGRFFDELLKKFGDKDGSSAVRSWEEFEKVVETANLRKELSLLAVH